MNIDFVITWVDGNDPLWKKERMQYRADKTMDVNAARYRDMETLKYWFRAVEKYAPWVNKIHFVTWGHFPVWLNTEHPKLHIVNHKDYIPEEYLPTFSSRPIELNLHRIPGLSENFVYFNDDIFLNAPVSPDFFFRKGLPCDFLNIDNIFCEGINDLYSHTLFNESHMINKHYSYIHSFCKHPFKYLNAAYTWKANLKNLIKLENRRHFPGFEDHHLATSFLKQSFIDLWEKDCKVLDQVSREKFRSPFGVSQRVVRYAQLAAGNFYPVSKASRGKVIQLWQDLSGLYKMMADADCKVLCLNDTIRDIDFEQCKATVLAEFEKKLPEPSDFEIFY